MRPLFPSFIVLTIVVGLFAGCQNLKENSPVDYDVSFVSRLREPVSEVQVKLGEYRAAVGYLAVNAHAGLGLFNRPFSSDAIIYWKKEADGSHWRASVLALNWHQLSVAARKEGRLRFTFDPEIVSVTFVAEDGKEYLLGTARHEPISTQEAPAYWR